MTLKSVLLFVGTFVLGGIVGAGGMTYFEEKATGSRGLAYRALADQAYGKGKLDEALTLTYTSITYVPDLYGNYVLLGDIYASLGRHDLAKNMYKIAIDKLSLITNTDFMSLTGNQRAFEESRIKEKLSKLL